MRIKVVIPFYKRQEQLDKCIVALEESIKVAGAARLGFEATYHIVNNSENNIGFPAAVNKVARDSIWEKANYLVVLNQDVYLKESALNRMVAFMEQHPDCAVGSIKQLSDINNDLIVHGGTLECYPAGKHITGLVSKGECAVNKRMPWANGAAMIIRVDLLPEFGLFDEGMFLIGSDADISLRARAAGYQVWYIADAVCVHEQGGVSSGRGGEDWMQRRMYLDMLVFRSKWIPTDLYKELMSELLL